MAELPLYLIADYSDEEATLHKQLIELRHTVYAHSDSKNYSIRPWHTGHFWTDIVGAPVLRMTAKDAKLFHSMSSKLLASIEVKMKALRAAAST